MTFKLPLRPLFVSALAAAFAASACVMPGQRAKTANSVEALSVSCGPDALVDNMEDNNNQGNVAEGRGGYWYTYVDEAGSTVDPPAGSEGGVFSQTEGGANGSKFAARVHGTLGNGAVIFGAMGLNFTDPKDAYDASAYQGISFWAKRGPGALAKVRVKLPDLNTDREAGICTECFNDFGAEITLTESWQKYVLSFSKLKQEAGWGSPRPRRVDKTQLYGVQFQAQAAGATYDIWVDDIELVGCGE